jgi:hypothetical protein
MGTDAMGVGLVLAARQRRAGARLMSSGSGGVGLCSVWCCVVLQARLLRPSFDTNVTAWWLHDYRTFGTIAMDLVKPSPGADVGGGGPNPGADVGGASSVPAQMWGVEPSPKRLCDRRRCR